MPYSAVTLGDCNTYSADHTRIKWICVHIYIYIQTRYLRGDRDSSLVRRIAIMNYALGRSHADLVHSFYICMSLFISTCVRRRKERDPSWVRRKCIDSLRTRQFTHCSSSRCVATLNKGFADTAEGGVYIEQKIQNYLTLLHAVKRN